MSTARRTDPRGNAMTRSRTPATPKREATP
jgi:hypothetical protein